MEKFKGTVIEYSKISGFGFIRPDIEHGEEFNPNVFVHMTALASAGIDDLQPGDRLSYARHEQKLPRSPKIHVAADLIEIVQEG